MIYDRDIVYVANAPATEWQKFIQTILTPLLVSTEATGNLADQL